MDIKAQIEELVAKLMKDEKLMDSFKKDPAKAIKGLLGNVDLPDGALDQLVKGVQGKMGADKVMGALGGLKNLIK